MITLKATKPLLHLSHPLGTSRLLIVGGEFINRIWMMRLLMMKMNNGDEILDDENCF